MKHTLIAAAVALLATGTAFAQSTVNVYGRVNVSVEAQKDGGQSNTIVQDNSSRIGFKGTEDLGGGLKAGFLLEAGFDVGNGQAQGRFFGRESNVYLEGGFGKLRLGNMGPTAAYFATADYISMHNHDTGTSSDAFYLYPGNATNMIAYTSPSFGGLVVEAQYGLKEAGTKNTLVLAANYDRGPLHLGFGYVDGPTTIGGIGLDDTKEVGVRGLYELGAFTVGAYWIRNTVEAPGLDVERDAWRLAGMYAFGNNELHANVGGAGKFKANGSSLADTDATQWTLGYNYNLSKRTKVYAFYTKVDNGSVQNYYSSAAGSDFSSLAVGLRHNF
jgi:predicted porin